MAEFTRPQAAALRKRLAEPRRFLQIVAGPRQTGKTTLVRQVTAGLARRLRYASADEPTLRERNREVDFVVRAGRTLAAVEVKSGRALDAQPGLDAFAEAFKPKRKLLVGGDGIALEEFLARPVEHWLRT